MTKFCEKDDKLKKSANFASGDNFSLDRCIIEETLRLSEHNMFVGKMQQMSEVYADLRDLERADLNDFWENERRYGGDKKR